ncbi:MAG TPA: TrmH family RNA methyltransferase, partial [Tianweitania sediminis]|nr:TrmH family RNA methyltransferase [Tianweitania sediminis]
MNNLRVALYQPEIPGNTGAVLRLGACLGLAIDVIEPTSFDISDKNLKRAGMDYLEMAALRRHVDFSRFDAWRREEGRRLVLLSTKAAISYLDFAFRPNDVLMLGRES